MFNKLIKKWQYDKNTFASCSKGYTGYSILVGTSIFLGTHWVAAADISILVMSADELFL